MLINIFHRSFYNHRTVLNEGNVRVEAQKTEF